MTHEREASSRPSARGVARRLVPYFAPYRTRLLVVALVLVATTLLELSGPYLIGVVVDQFLQPGKNPAPWWLRILAGEAPSRRHGLAVVMTMLGMAYVGSWGLRVTQFRLMVRVSQRVLMRMRMQILAQLHRLSLDFYDRHAAGDLMSRLTSDTQVINQMFGEGLLRTLGMVLSLVGIVVSMISLNWRLALASYAIVPVVLVVTIFFSRRVRRAYRETRRTIGEVSAELQENIAGVREVQAFAREAETANEFQAVNARNRLANVQAETLSSLFMPLLEVLSTMALAIVLGYGAYLVLGFDPPLATIGLIVAFLTYVRQFYQPVQELANLAGQMQSALAGAERIFELLDEVPTVQDAPDAIDLPPIAGRVVYDRVSFHYDEAEPVLTDVSAIIEPGQMVALVGPTGAGKTTFVNLLMRQYPLRGGTISVDGYDITRLTMRSLRAQIGMVPQDTFLFAGTVMDNIRYGRLDATDAEVVGAATLARAHAFIERLPQGYQTIVGERGANLSQGHRQLLAIARAILKDPRILVLDEATSAVDTRTERLIQRALETLLRGRTSLVIAHRLSTVRHADQILVIDGGVIVERGTHEELLARDGIYRGLYMSQFRRQEDVAIADLEGAMGGATAS